MPASTSYSLSASPGLQNRRRPMPEIPEITSTDVLTAGQLTCNPAPVIQPTDQIRNVLNALLTLVDGPPHKHRWSAIRSTVHQLGDMLAAHFRGELAPLPVDPNVPFS